jgi:ankyrin repeat protein
VSLLHYCVIINDTESLKFLLESQTTEPLEELPNGSKLNLNLLDREGLTALHHSAYLNDPISTSLLLDHGADIDVKVEKTKRTRLVSITVSGQTALEIAQTRKPPALDCVDLLLKQRQEVLK